MIAGDQSLAVSASDNAELDNLQSRQRDVQKEYEEFLQFTKEQQPDTSIADDVAIQKVCWLLAYLKNRLYSSKPSKGTKDAYVL